MLEATVDAMEKIEGYIVDKNTPAVILLTTIPEAKSSDQHLVPFLPVYSW
jgi:hypothetical protein